MFIIVGIMEMVTIIMNGNNDQRMVGIMLIKTRMVGIMRILFGTMGITVGIRLIKRYV
jgi:hypothetical protein